MDITYQLNNDKTVATVILNRVAKANALNKEFIEFLADILLQLAAIETLKVCVIESAAKHFCVGADIQWLKDSVGLNEADNLADVRVLADLLQQLYSMPCVVIAKVHGSVYGGGLGILACCDFVIANDNSQFCFSEINLGLAPATIAPYALHKMSLQVMRKLILSAKIFTTEEACANGLIDAIYAAEHIDAVLPHWIELFLSKPKSAIIDNKKMLAELAGINNDIVEKSICRLARMRQSETGQSCLNAFLEKRHKEN